MCRFWAYDESKKIVGAGELSKPLGSKNNDGTTNPYASFLGKHAPAWKLALAGAMGKDPFDPLVSFSL